MNTRHDKGDGPEDIDKAFAEIVAELEREAPLPQWPADPGHPTDPPDREGAVAERDDPGDTDAVTDDSTPAAPREISATGPDEEPTGPRDWAPDAAAPDAEDEGHFEPPEPPPVPTPKAGTIGGIVLILAGIAMLFVPGLAGWIGTLALPTGLVAISAGIGWLLFRMRHSPPESGWEDGAQL